MSWPCTSPMTAAAVVSVKVVEVAADVHAVAGGQIAGGDVEPGHGGQGVGQQGLLEGVREVVLGVVEACAVQGLGDEPGEGREERALTGGEQVRLVVGEEEAADGVPRAEQRQEGPGVLVGDLRGPGVEAGQFAPVGEERGGTGGQDAAGGREIGVRGHAVELLDDGGVVTAVSDDLDAASVGGGHDHAVGAERGQDPFGDEVDDVLDAEGVGQGGRQGHQQMDAAVRRGSGERVLRVGRPGPGDGPEVGRGPRAEGSGGEVGGDEHAGAVVVRVQAQIEPAARWAHHGQGDRLAAAHGGAVGVHVRDVVEPGQ